MTEAEFRISMVKFMNGGSSKLDRIKNATNYSKALTYEGATDNIVQIIHTGSTSKGNEKITQVIEYENPAVDGSRIIKISFS